MSSDKRDEKWDDRDLSRPNSTNRNDSKSIRCRIFVGNLNTEDLSREEFENIFAKHGRVIGCSVHNGFGFVQYEKESSADEAVTKEHGNTIKGKKVDVNLAGDRRKPEKRRPSSHMPRDRGPRDRSLSPRRRSSNDPLSIPGYREARDRYRDENPDSSGHRHYDEIPPKKSRPEYEFSPMSHKPYPPPAVGKPVEAPIDCEIIIIHKQQMAYAESVEKKLKSHGLVVECAHLPETIPLLDELEDAAKRGVLFGIIISSQHEVHRSVTVHILHGKQQEHRNMPLEDAILLVSRNFDTYMQALRDRELRPPVVDPLTPKKGYSGGVSSVVPSPYTRAVSTLLNIAADGRPLTIDEYTLVIDEFTKIRNDLLKKEGRTPPSSTGATFSSDPQSIALQQAELQAKILSILNPGSKLKVESKEVTNETTASSKPSLPVLTPSNSASNAFQAPASSGLNKYPSSNVIGKVLSNLRSASSDQSSTAFNSVPGVLATKSSPANQPYSEFNAATSDGLPPYAGYGHTAPQTWSRYQNPSQSIPMTQQASTQSYPHYLPPSHGGYHPSYPSGYLPPSRY